MVAVRFCSAVLRAPSVAVNVSAWSLSSALAVRGAAPALCMVRSPGHAGDDNRGVGLNLKTLREYAVLGLLAVDDGRDDRGDGVAEQVVEPPAGGAPLDVDDIALSAPRPVPDGDRQGGPAGLVERERGARGCAVSPCGAEQDGCPCRLRAP